MPIFLFFPAADGYFLETQLTYVAINHTIDFGFYNSAIALINDSSQNLLAPSAYWSLDNADTITIGSTTYIVDLVDGINGEKESGVTTGVDGQIQQAYDFDGTSNAAVRNTAWPSSLQVDDYTISAWVNVDDLSSNRAVISFGGDAGIYDQAMVLNTSSQVNYISYYGVGSADSFTSSSTISTGEWIHIAMVRDTKTNTLKGYLNGVLENSAALSSTSAYYGTGEMALGSRVVSAVQNMDGKIDEVSFWLGTLSTEQIESLYLRGLTNQKLEV